MSGKYANLPDIDSAPDVYETPDTFPSSSQDKNNSSGDEGPNNKSSKPAGDDREDLDSSNLPNRDEVNKKFRKAERRGRRTLYTYPPSPGDSSRSPSPSSRPPPLQVRLRALQHEIASLEAELADPANPLLQGEGTDPGEMMRGLVQVRTRLEQVSRKKDTVLEKKKSQPVAVGETNADKAASLPADDGRGVKELDEEVDARTLVEVDVRLGILEKLIGSPNATLDETATLGPPLLPHITRLATLLTLLTQPRHIDAISRRLKILLADLERYSNTTRRQGNATNAATGAPNAAGAPAPVQPSQIAADLAPVLSRLAPTLPTIPHLLARLRTLSALHTSASSFASTLTSLEDEQKKTRSGMEEIKRAIEGVEKSLKVNETRVTENMKGLLSRLESVQAKLASAEL